MSGQSLHHFSGYSDIKLNLSLHITGRREDGYHLLSSVTAFLKNSGDAISASEMVKGEKDSLVLEKSSFSHQLAQENPDHNLIIKALHILRKAYPHLPYYQILLHKEIPVASGMGGGSCDAAFVVREIAKHYDIDLYQEEIQNAFLALGADFPICLKAEASLVEGIGERIKPLENMPELYVLLINPLKAVSAMDAYKAYKAGAYGFSKKLLMPKNLDGVEDWLSWLERQHNDLQAPAIELCPEIGDCLSALMDLEQTRLVRMTGSGATCFAIFDDQQVLNHASAKLQSLFSDYWIRSGRIESLT